MQLSFYGENGVKQNLSEESNFSSAESLSQEKFIFLAIFLGICNLCVCYQICRCFIHNFCAERPKLNPSHVLRKV